LISTFGVLYNTRLLPDDWRFKSLKDLPGSKKHCYSHGVGRGSRGIAQLEVSLSITPAVIVAFLFIFGIVFVRSAISDVLDIQGDRLIGRETIPSSSEKSVPTFSYKE